MARASSIYTFAAFRAARGPLSFLVVIGALIVLWEVVKLVGGDPSEAWTPPFQRTVASDLNMPHVWDIAASFVEPAQRNGPPLGLVLINAGIFTFREAFGGFVFGAQNKRPDGAFRTDLAKKAADALKAAGADINFKKTTVQVTAGGN